jgi:hypothetical protein
MANIGSLNLTLAGASGGDGSKRTNAGGFGNLALNIGDAGSAWTQGFLSSTTNLLGASTVIAQGILTAAGNVLGNGNYVTSAGPYPNTTLSLAFNFFGNNNSVSAGWGPFAVAGAISQNLRTITQSLPGININRATAGGAAAVGSSRTAARPKASDVDADTTTSASARSMNASFRGNGHQRSTTTSPASGASGKKTAGSARTGSSGKKSTGQQQ